MFSKTCKCGTTKKNFKVDIGPFFVDECCEKAKAAKKEEKKVEKVVEKAEKIVEAKKEEKKSKKSDKKRK